MIKQVKNLLASCQKIKIPQYFSSSHAPTPTKLEKVTDTTVKFNVKNGEGQWQQIHGIVGQSFLQCILRWKVQGADNRRLCNGNDGLYRPHFRPHDPFSDGPNCGICRIVLLDHWYQKIMDETDGMTKTEEVQLTQFSDTKKDTRLACCIPVEKWMDGCTFEIYPPPVPSELEEVL